MSYQKIATAHKLTRVAAQLSLAIFVALLSSDGPALAAPPDTMPVWRVQLNVQTASVGDAGSDDDVRVKLNVNNGTWIDSGYDDFEPGSRTYDLRLDYVNRLSDIDYLQISKTGSDGWCLKRVRLIVNGATIYQQDYASGLWLDNDSGSSPVFFIDDYFMRMRGEWLYYTQPTRPNVVRLHDLRLRVESLLGDFVHNQGSLMLARQGTYTVEPYTLNASTWRVDLDLENDKQFPFPNTDVDVDFDLTVACLNGRPDFGVANINVDAPWPADPVGTPTFLNSSFKVRLNEMMKNYNFLRCRDVSYQIASNGDLHFNPIFVYPTPICCLTPIGTTAAPQDAKLSFDDDRAPLGVRVTTGGGFKADEETPFVATIKSSLTEDAEVDVGFTLPAQALLASAVVEAKQGAETRSLAPQVSTRHDGTTLVTLRDSIAAGRATSYTLRLTFRNGEGATAQIVTRVAPATPALAEKVTASRAATSFRFGANAISPEGTTVERSKFVAPDERRKALQ